MGQCGPGGRCETRQSLPLPVDQAGIGFVKAILGGPCEGNAAEDLQRWGWDAAPVYGFVKRRAQRRRPGETAAGSDVSGHD